MVRSGNVRDLQTRLCRLPPNRYIEFQLLITVRLASLLSMLLLLVAQTAFGQPKTDRFLEDLLLNSRHEVIHKVIGHRDSFRVQIIYTRIERDKNNKPSFEQFHFNVDPDLYFNPASTVKLHVALLSLEKLNEMKIKGVNKYTAMQFDSTFSGQVPACTDATAKRGLPSIAQYIRKAFLVSDNDAYNRMYQFVGQQTINRSLQQKGYKHTRINRQFMGFSEEQNRHTNQIRFVDDTGKVIYTQPPAYNPDTFDYSRTIKVGRAHLNSRDSLINEPIDFTKTNNVGLEDLQQLLQSVMFPASFPAERRFNLSKDDYDFLYRYLSQYPSETNYPKYDTSQYYDSYVKFYFRNGNRQMPKGVRVFNKVGWAYGFLIDVSYVADFENKVEFMLTSTVYVNSDGVLNDNKYEYESVGWPFLYELGQTIYEYEKKRPRQYVPDLRAFKIEYERRDPNDTREPIRDVDN